MIHFIKILTKWGIKWRANLRCRWIPINPFRIILLLIIVNLLLVWRITSMTIAFQLAVFGIIPETSGLFFTDSLWRSPSYSLISLTRSGIPTIIPPFHRQIIRSGGDRADPLVRMYLSFFSLKKLIQRAKKALITPPLWNQLWTHGMTRGEEEPLFLISCLMHSFLPPRQMKREKKESSFSLFSTFHQYWFVPTLPRHFPDLQKTGIRLRKPWLVIHGWYKVSCYAHWFNNF